MLKAMLDQLLVLSKSRLEALKQNVPSQSS